MDADEWDAGRGCVGEYVQGAWDTLGCGCEACCQQRDRERELSESDVDL